MIVILYLFVIGSIIGWIWEYTILHFKPSCDVFINQYSPIYLPVLPLYGIGSVLLYMISSRISNPYLSILTSITTLTFLELIVGKIMKNSKGAWYYDDGFEFCDNLISPFSIGMISIASLAFQLGKCHFKH